MTKKVKRLGKYFLLTLVSLVSVFPIFWMVVAATNKSVDVIGGKLTIGSHLIENYNTLISQQPLWENFGNSCKYTIAVTASQRR